MKQEVFIRAGSIVHQQTLALSIDNSCGGV